ncbi:hypothetical protein AB833_18240 [Chromatiales bacterium (ex Bugula neritina AB1)]|nr:hypothetical protein AB833_18240 [Chromatiales bacterium (ex Bugula neritina AB1)]
MMKQSSIKNHLGNTETSYRGTFKPSIKSFFSRRISTISGSMSRLRLALQIYQERRDLRTISEDSLRDIGIDRVSINREADRSIFDIPDNRL